MNGMVSDVAINSVTQNSFWPKKWKKIRLIQLLKCILIYHTLVEEACPDSSMRILSFGILQKASKFSISVQPFKDKLAAAAILEIVLTAVTADWLALQENGIVVPSFSRF